MDIIYRINGGALTLLANQTSPTNISGTAGDSIEVWLSEKQTATVQSGSTLIFESYFGTDLSADSDFTIVSTYSRTPTYSVQTSGPYGNYSRVSIPTGGAWDGICFRAAGVSEENCEVLMLARVTRPTGVTEANQGFQTFLRAAGGSTLSRVAYFTNGSTSGLEHPSSLNGNTLTSLTSAATSPSLDTRWMWYRCQINGTAVKYKYWEDGTSEPGSWNFDTTTSNRTGSGYVEWFYYRANSATTPALVDLAYCAVAAIADAPIAVPT